MNARAMQAGAIWVPEYSSGQLTALKWLGVVLMTGDHIDAVFFGRSLGWLSDLGRLVFPIFAFVLAYNMARPGLDPETGVRILRRLFVVGILAAIPHWLLFGQHGIPALNVLFTLMGSALVVQALERKQYFLACALFALVGVLVEYWWPGIAFFVAVWAMYRWRSPIGPPVVLLAASLLVLANGSHVALWALPVILLVSGVHLKLPRAQGAFYAYYPAHLWILALVAAPGA